MGDAYVGLAAGGEGVFWNPGSVAMGRRISAMVGYDRPFGLSEFDTVSGASALRIGVVGIGLQYQGMQASALMETTSGLVLGLRVNAVGTGLRFRSVQAQVSGRAPRQWVVADLSVLIVSSTGVQVGLVGHNVTGKKVGVLGQGGMGGLGVTWGTTTIALDVQKEAGTPTGSAFGIEFRPSEIGRIRFGVGGHPERLTMGLGVRKSGAEFDYGIWYHTVLGLSHRMSISFTR